MLHDFLNDQRRNTWMTVPRGDERPLVAHAQTPGPACLKSLMAAHGLSQTQSAKFSAVLTKGLNW